MQPPTNVNIAAMQTGQVVLAQRPQSTLNVRVIRALAITQVVFGALSFILGIIPLVAISNYWMSFVGFGIWFGVWIVVTGIIGIFSARKPQNGALNGTNMGFNIFCLVVSFLNGCFFAAALAYYDQCTILRYRARYYVDYYGRYVSTSGYYEGDGGCNNQSAGMAIYSLLMLLMIAEFFVSLFITIFSCKGCSCCGRSNNDQHVMVQQPVGYSTNGSAITTTNTGYPQAAYPGTAIMHSSGAPIVFQTYPQQGQMMVQQNPQQNQMMVPQNSQQQGQMVFPQNIQQGQMMVSQNPQQQGQMVFPQNIQQGQMMFPQNIQQGQLMVPQNPQQQGQMMFPQNIQQGQMMVQQSSQQKGQMMFSQNPQPYQMMVPQNSQQSQMMLSQNPHQSQMIPPQKPQQSQMMVPQSPQQGQTIASQSGMIAGQTSAGYVSPQQVQQPPDYQNSQLDDTDIITPQ